MTIERERPADETTVLDPSGAGEFDDLIATLQKTLDLTVFMVTHDLDSLYAICDRVAVLGEGKGIEAGFGDFLEEFLFEVGGRHIR